MKRRTALLNQLRDLAFVIFPEFVQVMKGMRSKSAHFILRHYPTPQSIACCGLGSMTAILKKVSRGRLGEERTLALYEGAINSVGVIEGRESILLEIREILSALEATEHFIADFEERMSGYLKEIPYSRFILSLKGIGEITAAGLIGEVGDFSKFATISEMMKLAAKGPLFVIGNGSSRSTPITRVRAATTNVSGS